MDVTTAHGESHVHKDTLADDDSVMHTKRNATKEPIPMKDDKKVGPLVFASGILHFMVASCLLACIIMNNYEKCSTTLPPAIIVVVLAFSCCFNVVAVILLFLHETNVPHEKTAILGVELMSIVSSVFMILVMAYFVKVPPRLLIVIESHEASQLNKK
ncbi:unnamed protein product [Cylicostephanus goldi]|uniref:Uncharacterized protein n=1 Tax=Cylicostephanus goldi TaxID=71465 RepID=A0A3P6T808_CYLGO|nr:unnamed protein product [Cylicostephanus goldi]